MKLWWDEFRTRFSYPFNLKSFPNTFSSPPPNLCKCPKACVFRMLWLFGIYSRKLSYPAAKAKKQLTIKFGIQFVPATNGKTKVSVVYSAIGTKNVFSIFMLAHCFGCFGVNYNYNIMIIIIIIMLLEIVWVLHICALCLLSNEEEPMGGRHQMRPPVRWKYLLLNL